MKNNMHKHFSKYRITFKLFFLALSITFLIRGFAMYRAEMIVEHTQLFVINLEENGRVTDQISAIDNYLATVTGQSVWLATFDGTKTTTILPATTDYELYKVYLHSIDQSAMTGDTHLMDASSSSHDAASAPTMQDNMLNAALTILFALLALFL